MEKFTNMSVLTIQEQEVLKKLVIQKYISQRELAEALNYSLGTVNKAINGLLTKQYIDEKNTLTEVAREYISINSPKRAIILAAGFGMRMIPINRDYPKALLEIKGEKLIERIIRQLHEASVYDIVIAVGFMKESFDYLIDEYGVKLVIYPEYSSHNNMHTLKRVIDKRSRDDVNVLANTYIIPADIWSEFNPFSKVETHSWYMVGDRLDTESDVKSNRKNELVRIKTDEAGNAMIGITYLTKESSENVKSRIDELTSDYQYNNCFWEEALFENGRMIVPSRIVDSDKIVEINTYEQLRELDSTSGQLKTDSIKTIAEALSVNESEISEINVLKKGMTNRSFLFSAKGQKYIMRIPGEGTGQLIDRNHEYNVYQAISGKGLCDNPVYINPDNGYKITNFLDNVRVCNLDDENDLVLCMKKLREFHEMSIHVEHEFDLFEQIELYEKLNNNEGSMYRDYATTKRNVFELREYIDAHAEKKVLTHIDAVPDNFLFYTEDGSEKLQLTDWEYAGMQDPHVDVAMFIIYSFYDKKQADKLIDIYFEGECSKECRAKMYCYIAVCGLLWSNWSEYKSSLGVEFGEYGMIQYRYAKDYYKYAVEAMKEN